MISLSTPFSLETASTTIRISLFIVRTPLYAYRDSRRQRHLSYARDLPVRNQPRPVNVFDRQAHLAAIRLERNLALAYLLQTPLKSFATVDLLNHLDLDPLAGKAGEVALSPQHPIQSGR